MAFEIPTDEVPDDPTQSYNVKPGSYHVRVAKVDEDGGRNGEMIVDYEILAGTTPGQEAQIHRDYFSKSTKAASRMYTLAIATGLISLDEFQAAKKAGRSMTIDFMQAVDRQLCVDLHEEDYQGKVKTKAGFGLYRVDDKRVQDKKIPLNQGMLAQFAKTVSINMPAPASTATSAPSSSSDPFGGAI